MALTLAVPFPVNATDLPAETSEQSEEVNEESSDASEQEESEENIENSENTEESSSEEVEEQGSSENTETEDEKAEENSEDSEAASTEELTEESTEVLEENTEIAEAVEGTFHIYYNGCDLKDDLLYNPGDTVVLLNLSDELFAGWATKDNAKEAQYHAGDELTFEETDIILYAVFREEKKETFRLSRDNSMSFTNSANISIDGNFSDWDGLPYSYEYNWDNSENCWYWGVWVDTPEGQICYKTPEGEYSVDVRHKMQLYCDGKNVYYHLVIATQYGSQFNGEDYQLYIDGNMAAFQVEWPGGGTITGNLEGQTAPGTYRVEVKHRDSSMSYDEAIGSCAYLRVPDDYRNVELEISIPLEELVRQNSSINTDTMSTIEFFCPNLMYRRIVCSGTPTFPVILGGICVVIVLIAFLFNRSMKNLDSL